MAEVTSPEDAPRPGAADVAGSPVQPSALAVESEWLRRPARQRVVVEQAIGLLGERHGIPPDDAAAQLRLMAAERGEALIDVAAALLGVRAPSDPSHLRRTTGPRTDPGLGDDVARLVGLAARPSGAVAVVIYALGADGALRLRGSAWLERSDVQPWATIPPELDVPLTRAVTTGRPVLLGSRRDRDRLFPLMAGVRSVARATASLPVHGEDGVVAVIGLVWDAEQDFDDAAEASLSAVGRACEGALAQVVSQGALDVAAVGAALDGSAEPWLLLHPYRDADGLDSRVLLVSSRVRGGRDLVGRALTEICPTLARSRLRTAIAAALRLGCSEVDLPADTARELPLVDDGAARAGILRVGTMAVLRWRPV